MFHNQTKLCEIVLLHAVQFLHVSPDVSDHLLGVITEFQKVCDMDFVIRTENCFSELRHHGQQDNRVVYFSNTIGFEQMQKLQITCYPQAGVWCLLDDVIENLSLLANCDVYFVSENEEFLPFLLLEQTGLKMFTLTAPDQVCSRGGVPDARGNFRASFDGLHLRVISLQQQFDSVYFGRMIRAENLTALRRGYVEGFERRLLRELSRKFNFTYDEIDAPSRMNTYGFSPLPVLFWENKTLGYLINRKGLMVIGDISILDPRPNYFDFTYVHDTDVCTFLAKVDIKLYSGGELLHIIGGPVSVSYLSCVLVITLFFFAPKIDAPESYDYEGLVPWLKKNSFWFLNIFVYFASYIARPNDNLKLEHRKGVSTFLLIIWRFGMIMLTLMFLCVLIAFVTSPELEGKCHTLKNIAEALKRVPKSRIYSVPATRAVLVNVYQMMPDTEKGLFKTLDYYTEVYDSETFIEHMWTSSRISFIYGETAAFRRIIWKNRMEDVTFQPSEHTFNSYQAIALQKGCTMRDNFTELSQRLIETGHLIMFKKNAGMHLENEPRVPIVERPMMLNSFASIFLLTGIVSSLCIVILLAEIFEQYQFIVKSPPRPDYDFLDVLNYLKARENSKPRPHDCGYSTDVSQTEAVVWPRCGSVESCVTPPASAPVAEISDLPHSSPELR